MFAGLGGAGRNDSERTSRRTPSSRLCRRPKSFRRNTAQDIAVLRLLSGAPSGGADLRRGRGTPCQGGEACDDSELAEFVKTPTGRARIRAVHHFGGGNPRIYTMFSQFLTRTSLDDLTEAVMQTLEKLTPYYQSRMALLSAQQRKIVEYLIDRRARHPSRTSPETALPPIRSSQASSRFSATKVTCARPPTSASRTMSCASRS